jgi:SpoVK/Ycf46/Vps4 family AAA+-type ATPase
MYQMPLEELEAKVDSVTRAAEQAYQEEKIRMAEREVHVNKEIDRLMFMAGTLEDVIRWLHQAEETEGDESYLEYKLGVNYGFFARLRAV